MIGNSVTSWQVNIERKSERRRGSNGGLGDEENEIEEWSQERKFRKCERKNE